MMMMRVVLRMMLFAPHRALTKSSPRLQSYDMTGPAYPWHHTKKLSSSTLSIPGFIALYRNITYALLVMHRIATCHSHGRYLSMTMNNQDRMKVDAS